ncbi:hypothetical protein OSB04_010179 [Centaurea solstitialis]|uniref:PGG domain-containing protein n=1 Tax=Centaurea solstitialis TaxID=347529 RepID=A0AA38TIU0_9ASTR|nr:hypothetical protein OSB04_010179 [Centaurea solstitialis]
MEHQDESFHLRLREAVYHDNWNSVSKLFEEHPEHRTKPINGRSETLLMLAVGTNQSHRFVEALVSSLSKDGLIDEALAAQNNQGDTALHYAATVRNVIDFTLLVSMSSKPVELAFQNNDNGRTPLLVASYQGKKNEMLELLFLKLGVLNPRYRGFPKRACVVAISLVLPLKANSSVLYMFMINEFIFATKLFIISIYMSSLIKHIYIIDHVAAPIMDIYDMKVTHTQATQLVQCLCVNVVKRRKEDLTKLVFTAAMTTAVQFETLEVIEEIICASPSIAEVVLAGSDFFHDAIKQRQMRLYKLLYQITSYRMLIASRIDETTNESVLHVVAKLVPSHQFTNRTGGAALQMQHELQWFKEIETNLVEPSYKEYVDKDGKTPAVVFTETHKDLLKEGQTWMKDTATSSTVVAAFIVTVAFAAVFTAPGGNKSEGKNEGKPVYLDNGAFMLFIISDAVALFSSVTSVLMFLGILTSRYAQEDFYYTLPRRMTIGLISLLVSLAAMIVAFSATLAIVLKDKVKWIAAPLMIITCIPVGAFVVLQYPLLKKLIQSTCTCGSIFRKKRKRMLRYT